MYLPEPDKPIRHLPRVTVYHYYPMNFTLDMDDMQKDKNGKAYKGNRKNYAVAYMNIVMPQRDAEVYRRSKEQYVDFGMDYIVDRDNSRMFFHNCYGLDEHGARALTNVIVYHKQVYDGANPDEADTIIGGEDVLVSAMGAMLKKLTQVPFLPHHVPLIVQYARSMEYGAVQYLNSNEWHAPRWTIVRDRKLWDKIILDWVKR